MNRALFSGQRIPREFVLLPTEEYYRRRQRGSRRGRWLLFIVTALAVCLAALGARADGVTLEQVGSGDLLFTGTEAGRYTPALHLSSATQIRVRGLVAEVQLEQEFANRSDAWQEAVYVFPLPEQAAVSGMRIEIGERRIVGEIRERERAQKIYQAAREQGKRAALLEQQRPNLFTSRIANIAPGEKIRVHIRFLQPVEYDSGVFSLRLPTTLTPRYIPGERPGERPGDPHSENDFAVNGEGWALPTDQVPDAHKITPFMLPATELAGGSHRMQIAVDLSMGLPLADISSPYHEIEFSRQGDDYQVRLREGAAVMDRDFSLRWRPRAASAPRAALFLQKSVQQGDAGASYLQLLLLPPDTSAQAPRLPREVIYVIDTSGSMAGTSMRQAKQSLQLALSRLQPGDSFNVIEFNSVTRAFFPHPVAAGAENLAAARALVGNLRAGGGTEMAPALRLALGQQSTDASGELVRQVIFITDGAVGNERALLALIEQSLGQARLFTLGIGSAPNSHFMRKAAQFGRGASVTIGDLGEVQEKMQALFTKLENPLVTDLLVQWPAGIAVDAYPRKLPDLYRGQPIQLVAKLEGQLDGEVRIGGRLAGRQFHNSLPLSSVREGEAGIGSVWARAKIESLRDRQLQVGERGEAGAALREQILELALAHQLASPYTSFVAVEEQPARPRGEGLSKSPLPNVVARGQLLQQHTYPATAAGLYAQLLLGAGLLSLAALLRLARRWRGALLHRLRRILRRLLPQPARSGRGALERGLTGGR